MGSPEALRVWRHTRVMRLFPPRSHPGSASPLPPAIPGLGGIRTGLYKAVPSVLSVLMTQESGHGSTPEASPGRVAPSAPSSLSGQSRDDVDRTRALDVIITHLWEPHPRLGMAGLLWLPLLISAGTWEKGVPAPAPHPGGDEKEQSHRLCAEGRRQKTFINDPLSYLRDTF